MRSILWQKHDNGDDGNQDDIPNFVSSWRTKTTTSFSGDDGKSRKTKPSFEGRKMMSSKNDMSWGTMPVNPVYL